MQGRGSTRNIFLMASKRIDPNAVAGLSLGIRRIARAGLDFCFLDSASTFLHSTQRANVGVAEAEELRGRIDVSRHPLSNNVLPSLSTDRQTGFTSNQRC
jgi:hypothetical protein